MKTQTLNPNSHLILHTFVFVSVCVCLKKKKSSMSFLNIPFKNLKCH